MARGRRPARPQPGDPDLSLADGAGLAAAAGIPGGARREQRLWDEHPNALDFLQSLRSIGADLPADHARPLSPGALRRILRQVDAQGHVRATYHVLTVLWRKG